MEQMALARAVRGDAARAAPPPALRAWRARLELGIERRGAASVLALRRHSGPLRVQKALYPEGAELAHLVLLHPPAGIAGGDELEIDVHLGAGSLALVTTPGATKWYRSGGAEARQTVRLVLDAGAALEWLPQEAIVFDGAEAQLDLALECARGARLIGWEMLVLGRRAAAETFASGRLTQRVSLYDDGRLLWRERGALEGGDALFASPAGWDGAHVSGVMWIYGAALDEALIGHCRTLGEAGLRFGCTRIGDQLILVRALSHSAERLRALFVRLWCAVRPALLARPAQLPRIWAT
jgi:urease accessory protein